ncbi:MAG TPA: 5-formyltetrahydrofolate cyclo-ligase [Firmicutes bacterium]|nr:5-formyltetrahydrofolate cyclo-ligase [Bacillota bacterium]
MSGTNGNGTGCNAKEDAGARAKKEMRRRIRALRESLSAAEIALRSKQVIARLMDAAGGAVISQLADKQVFALYYPTKNEVDVRPLVENLWRRQKIVLFPRICPDTNLMEFRQVHSFADFTAGPFKLLEPDSSCPIWASEQIEAVIVPGVAFDLQGYRIGFGGGYYDRFLPLVQSGAVKIAPVFEFQIVDELPHEAHDQKVDWLVSEARLIRAGQA